MSRAGNPDSSLTRSREALTSAWVEAKMRVPAQSRAMPNVFNAGNVVKQLIWTRVRWNPKNDDTSDAAARVILHQVAERHRTLPPAYFEQVINNTSYFKIYYLPPNKMREEITSKDLSTVHISDGEFHWQIDTATNKYSRYPDEKNPWSIFTDLNEIAGTSRIIGHELLYGVPCTVILFNTIYRDRLEYWIEDERHLVRQVKWPKGNMTYPVIRLNDTMKPELFKYDPKVTNAGRIHVGAHFKLQSR